MENPTANVNATGGEKSPDEIEREMLETRDSITEKVAALENQVLGNIQSVTSGVTEAVQTVKEAVATAPTAVSDTVKQTVAAVKETVRDTVGSFSVTECVRDNPLAALGTTTVAGFLAGYFLTGGERSSSFSRPIMAQGRDVPVPGGRVASAHTAYAAPAPAYAAPAPSRESAEPGLFGNLLGMVGKQVRDLAEQALSTAVASLQESIKTRVPQMVDTAVSNVTERVACATESHGNGATRVAGPNYSASAPPM